MGSRDFLKDYYERTHIRFPKPSMELKGRDLIIYELLRDIKCNRCVVLDYGCGSGALLLSLLTEDRFIFGYGVDISQNLLTKLKEYAKERGIFNKLKVMEPKDDSLPDIPDNSVDIIICTAVIEHVLDPYRVLDEFYRIGKDNAILIASVPNYGYIKHIVHLILGIQPKTGTDEPVEKWREVGWDGMHIHTFTKSSFEILLKDCGWLPEKWVGWGTKFNNIGFGFLRKKFPRLFSGELMARCKKIIKTP